MVNFRRGVDLMSNQQVFFMENTAAIAAFETIALSITSTNGTQVAVRDCRFITSGGNYPPVNMTNNTSPSPYVASCSPSQGATDYYPFDGSTGTQYFQNATSVVIQCDMGAGNLIVVTGIYIWAAGASAPKSGDIIGYPGGVVIGSFSGQTGWATAPGEGRTIMF